MLDLAAKPKPAVKPRRPLILLADDSDAPRIRDMVCRQYPYLEHCDWRQIRPWWLVAVLDERIVGAIQMAGSVPIGRLEYLCIDPGLTHRVRAQVAAGLMRVAMAYCRHAGCSMVQGIVGRSHGYWTERLLKRGGVVVVSGDMVATRLK